MARILAAVGLVLFLALEAAAFTTRDMLGREVTLAALPRRIVSLVPSVTEIVYALGAEDHLAGVTDFCDYPPAARAKPRVGGMVTPNLEAIVALKPDLVVATTEGGREETVAQLKRLRIPTYLVAAHRVSDMMALIARVGELTERRSKRGQGGTLWRLGGHDRVTIDPTQDSSVAGDRLQRVGHRRCRDRRATGAHGLKHRLQELRRHTRSSRVVDQDRSVIGNAGGGQRGQAGHHRVDPLRPADDHQAASLGRFRQRRAESVDGTLGHDERHELELGQGEQRIERPTPGGTPKEVDPQLVGAHPSSRPGGHQDRDRRVAHHS